MHETRKYTALSDPELVDLLFTEEDRLPRAAVDEFLRRGVPLSPALVRILDDEATWSPESRRWWATVHASYILAAMQPPGALDALLRALERAERYAVEWITDPMPSMLASFGPRAVDILAGAAADASRGKWVRIPILEALHHIGAAHDPARDRAADVFRSLASDASAPRDLRQWAALDLLPFARPDDRELLLSLAGGGGFDILYDREDVDRALQGEAEPLEANSDWLDFYSEPQRKERRGDAGRSTDVDVRCVLERDALSDILGDIGPAGPGAGRKTSC